MAGIIEQLVEMEQRRALGGYALGGGAAPDSVAELERGLGAAERECMLVEDQDQEQTSLLEFDMGPQAKPAKGAGVSSEMDPGVLGRLVGRRVKGAKYDPSKYTVTLDNGLKLGFSKYTSAGGGETAVKMHVKTRKGKWKKFSIQSPKDAVKKAKALSLTEQSIQVPAGFKPTNKAQTALLDLARRGKNAMGAKAWFRLDKLAMSPDLKKLSPRQMVGAAMMLQRYGLVDVKEMGAGKGTAIRLKESLDEAKDEVVFSKKYKGIGEFRIRRHEYSSGSMLRGGGKKKEGFVVEFRKGGRWEAQPQKSLSLNDAKEAIKDLVSAVRRGDEYMGERAVRVPAGFEPSNKLQQTVLSLLKRASKAKGPGGWYRLDKLAMSGDLQGVPFKKVYYAAMALTDFGKLSMRDLGGGKGAAVQLKESLDEESLGEAKDDIVFQKKYKGVGEFRIRRALRYSGPMLRGGGKTKEIFVVEFKTKRGWEAQPQDGRSLKDAKAAIEKLVDMSRSQDVDVTVESEEREAYWEESLGEAMAVGVTGGYNVPAPGKMGGYSVPVPGKLGPKPKKVKKAQYKDKWSKGYIELFHRGRRGDVLEPVEGYLRGVWAVHKPGHFWAISHAPTGMSAWSGFDKKNDAKEVVDAFLKEFPALLMLGKDAEPSHEDAGKIAPKMNPYLKAIRGIIDRVKSEEREAYWSQDVEAIVEALQEAEGVTLSVPGIAEATGLEKALVRQELALMGQAGMVARTAPAGDQWRLTHFGEACGKPHGKKKRKGKTPRMETYEGVSEAKEGGYKAKTPLEKMVGEMVLGQSGMWLTKPQMKAVIAALGKRGIYEGLDEAMAGTYRVPSPSQLGVSKVDHSAHPTVVEYAVREMLKGKKGPVASARFTAKNLNGYDNMFIDTTGPVSIDPKKLEAEIWGRLIDQVKKNIDSFKPGKQDMALGAAADFFKLGKRDEAKLKKLASKRLGVKFTEDMDEEDECPLETYEGLSEVKNFTCGPYSDPSAAHEKAMKIKSKGGKSIRVDKSKGKWVINYAADKMLHEAKEGGYKAKTPLEKMVGEMVLGQSGMWLTKPQMKAVIAALGKRGIKEPKEGAYDDIAREVGKILSKLMSKAA